MYLYYIFSKNGVWIINFVLKQKVHKVCVAYVGKLMVVDHIVHSIILPDMWVTLKKKSISTKEFFRLPFKRCNIKLLLDTLPYPIKKSICDFSILNPYGSKRKWMLGYLMSFYQKNFWEAYDWHFAAKEHFFEKF